MAFADPQTVIKQFDLNQTSVVADFGAGSGVWTIALAKYLTGGLVYAIDVQKDLLDRLHQSARQAGVANIQYLWGDLENRGGSKLADNQVEAVLMANVLFQSKLKYSIALEAKRILKPNGKVIVIEWRGSFGGLGPQEADLVLEPELVDIFTQAGFRKATSFEVGDHHYGMIFRKQ